MNVRLKMGFLIAVVAAGVGSAAMAGTVNPDRSNIGPGPPPPPPPPPPPRPPPPPPPTDYVVYFGFDKASIPPEARKILRKAAKDVAAIVRLDRNYRKEMIAYTARDAMPGQPPEPLWPQAKEAYAPVSIVVAYTDTSGSDAYNLRLSERRAKAVAGALVKLGVAPGVINASWKGEADPAVNTGDDVKERVNRRVTIHVGPGGY